MDRSPWHAGEQTLQTHMGVAERMEAMGRKVIRSEMPEQHRQFFEQLPFVLLGTVDGNGLPWATVLEGEPGFAYSPDPGLLILNSLPDADDPAQIEAEASIGLLGIELHTRRRNRVNGRVNAITADGLQMTVDQSFGNCPKYIQPRQFRSVALTDPTGRQAQRTRGLDDAARMLISQADAFFVASYADVEGERRVDVSHRGGRSGFVQVEGDCLTIPDYSGNRFFNTLGNLLLNPRAGLLFIDFMSGELLQICGRTEIFLNGPTVENVDGAERVWKLHVQQVVRRPAALALRWDLLAA